MEAKRAKMEARRTTEAILEAKWEAKATDGAATGGGPAEFPLAVGRFKADNYWLRLS